MSVQEERGSKLPSCYRQLRFRMEFVYKYRRGGIIRVESFERDACERYSREGQRELKPVQSSDFLNKQLVGKRKKSLQPMLKGGTSQFCIKVCASTSVSLKRRRRKERRQKRRSECGVTAAVAAMTFAGPAIRIKGRNRMRRSTL